MKKFFKHIEKFILGGITAFLIFIFGFLWWIFDANYLVPLWVIFLVVIIAYGIIVIIYAIFSIKKESVVYRLPLVKKIHREGEEITFIVEKNELFSQGSFATISYHEDEESLEIILGLGYVQSVTEKFLQIKFDKIIDDKIVKKILEDLQDTSTKKQAIKIKPSINKDLMEEN